MPESLYEYPELYDILYAEKDYEKEVDFMSEKIEELITKPEKILILGCGTGEHSVEFVKRGYDVTAVDQSPKMIERAKSKTSADFRVGSIPGLNIPKKFDAVLLPFGVLNFIDRDSLPETLTELTSLMKEDGILIFDNVRPREEEKIEFAARREDGVDYGFFTRSASKTENTDQYYHVMISDMEDSEVSMRIFSETLHNYNRELLENLLKELGFQLTIKEGGYVNNGYLQDDIDVYVAY